MKFGILKGTVAATALVVGFGFSVSSFAADHFAIHPATTVLYLKSDIKQGSVTGFDCDGACDYAGPHGFPTNATTIHWTYSGDVYAPAVSAGTGEQMGPSKKIGTVTGHPSFPANKFGAFLMIDPNGGDPAKQVASMVQDEAMPWTCTDCDLEIGGSTFRKIPNMPLTGRSFVGLGSVANPEGYLALRMAGCAGIQEVSGEGDYANMQGTICLNGTIGFQPNFDGVGTSNCVLNLMAGPYSPTVSEQ